MEVLEDDVYYATLESISITLKNVLVCLFALLSLEEDYV